MLIGQGQGEAPDAIAGGELPLEVGGPQVVGLGGIRGHDARVLMLAAGVFVIKSVFPRRTENK